MLSQEMFAGYLLTILLPSEQQHSSFRTIMPCRQSLLS
jgi:hypothetical protein